MKRNEILDRLRAEQEKIIENLKNQVERYRVASDIDEDSTVDPEDLSRQAEAKDMQLRFEKLLNYAQREMAFLDEELSKTHQEIEDGTLILTDRKYFFVGVSVPVFDFEGTPVMSFSYGAPVFAKFKGKKPGDKVEVGEESYTIKEIY